MSKLTVEQIKRDTGYTVKNADMVVKLALIYHPRDTGRLGKLWKRAETAAPERIPEFKQEEFFYQHEVIRNLDSWCSLRYYTPAENILERPAVKSQ